MRTRRKCSIRSGAYPREAYIESMRECLRRQNGVPQWYLAVENGRLAGGLGVIEKDFHSRGDLTPNVCALYVRTAYRRRGIAGRLLDCACADMAGFGIGTLYLITEHTSFFEKYGWRFLHGSRGGYAEAHTDVQARASADRLRKRSFAAACRTGVSRKAPAFSSGGRRALPAEGRKRKV